MAQSPRNTWRRAGADLGVGWAGCVHPTHGGGGGLGGVLSKDASQEPGWSGGYYAQRAMPHTPVPPK